ncbi:PAS domain-containing protein [Zunongwangia endophytica]|uniref:PAS domain-containing protein n=1 Tax=Zunongwangia endophytica TaxID=1808945 RepID=A0ABV8H4P5_9FLAO|nr:PAS domain-containing protein [Zunongwangia endophytica]MDN3595502.1 PAS domain-containing protein [Zunongwangia endophytica]
MAPETDYNLSSLDLFLSNKDAEGKNLPIQQLHPLTSLDVFANHSDRIRDRARKKIELASLVSLSKKYSWNTNLDFILDEDYEAILLTKADQTILWTNKGFSAMTGYPANFAKGKKPKFLQGTKTSVATRKKIRNKVSSQTNFSDILLNYRKNGEEYLCKIDIYPIKNNLKEVTHFLALEKEIYDN